MLTFEESGWRAYRNTLYYFCNLSVSLKLFQNKKSSRDLAELTFSGHTWCPGAVLSAWYTRSDFIHITTPWERCDYFPFGQMRTPRHRMTQFAQGHPAGRSDARGSSSTTFYSSRNEGPRNENSRLWIEGCELFSQHWDFAAIGKVAWCHYSPFHQAFIH